ncbi:propanediol utilization protein [Acidimangrovimonas pyrenivorans]|uniref:Propanediol utilization protein n=1 Tax=Acidimangrovimonas pyrenivorans TaxID=2030798 RepID=A0ABV7AJ31_9RHOB
MRLSGARASVAGHFGELLQGRLGPAGPVALVSLPCPALRVTAWLRPDRRLRLHSPQRLIRLSDARRLLTDLGLAPRGAVALRADMPPGGGAGASTAALVALARCAAPGLAPATIARACHAVEGATDPLMFARSEGLLWASRAARVLGPLPALPAFDILGGFLGPARRTDPADCAFPDISDLLAPWSEAAARSDLPALARLATLSAERTLALRGPAGDPTAALARSLGALGIVIAHTGSARGLIFAPGTRPESARATLRRAGFHGLVHFRAGGHG